MRSMITAHAGAENTVANTVESLKKLAQTGVDCIEMDVRRAPDGPLVLSHNPVQTAEGSATLEQGLLAVADVPGLRVNIDLKQEGLIASVAEVARATGMEKRILFTGSAGDDELPYAIEHALPVWYNRFLLPPIAWADPFRAIRRKGLSVLNVYWRLPGETMLRTHPGELSLWTVDAPEDQARLLRFGVANITTRFPCEAMRLRETLSL